MHGCGNDYIFIDCFNQEIVSPESLSAKLSNRHTGIGGDGIVLIIPSGIADALMRMFNQDGSEGLMCGNAIRCVAKYLYDNNIARKAMLRIETMSGVRSLWLIVENGEVTRVRVDMGQMELAPPKVPVMLPVDRVISTPVAIGGDEYKLTCLSIGNPHAVVFIDEMPVEPDLRAIGPLFEYNALFPDRVNLEIVEVVDDRSINVKVWERGSGETLACGTGACAAAVASVLNGRCAKNEDIYVRLPGGELTVKYTDAAVYLTGDCIKVFDGTVEV